MFISSLLAASFLVAPTLKAAARGDLRVVQTYANQSGEGVLLQTEEFVIYNGHAGEWSDEISSVGKAGWYFGQSLEGPFHKLATNSFYTTPIAHDNDADLKGSWLSIGSSRNYHDRFSFIIYRHTEEHRMGHIHVSGELEAVVNRGFIRSRLMRKGSLKFNCYDQACEYVYLPDVNDALTQTFAQNPNLLVELPEMRQLEQIFRVKDRDSLLILDSNKLPGIGDLYLESFRAFLLETDRTIPLPVAMVSKNRTAAMTIVEFRDGSILKIPNSVNRDEIYDMILSDGLKVHLQVAWNEDIRSLQKRGFNTGPYLVDAELPSPCVTAFDY